MAPTRCNPSLQIFANGTWTSLTVRLEGKWYDVPPEALVEGHNRAGHAVVWTYPLWMGGEEGYAIRCFMPGTMG